VPSADPIRPQLSNSRFLVSSSLFVVINLESLLPRYAAACHHGMVRPRVAEGDGLHIWRVAVYSRQGVVLQLGGLSENNNSREKRLFMKCHTGLGLGRII